MKIKTTNFNYGNDTPTATNAAIYARYSSDNQREVSLEDQISVCIEYADRNGLKVNINNIFKDSATSGSLRDRAGLENLIATARAREIDAIIIDDLSRISRDAAHTLTLIKELDYLGIKLLAVADVIDTSDENSKRSYQYKSLANEDYIDDLRKKTLRGQVGQLQRGFTLGEKTFGYNSEPVGEIITLKKGRSRPEGYKMKIVPSEAATIQRIFRMYAGGKAIAKIVRILNEEKVPSSRHSHGRWNSSTIHSLLRNEKYIGIWSWGKRQNKRHPITGVIKPVLRPGGPLIVREFEDLRIIPQELWDEVQEQIKRNEKSWPRGKKGKGGFSREQESYVHRYPKELFSGAMVCSECGSAIGKVSGKGVGYYGCMRAGKKGCKNTIKVRKDIVENIIISEVSKIIGDIDNIRYMLGKVEKLSSDMLCTVPGEIKVVKDELKHQKKMIDNFVKFISEGNFSKSITESLTLSEMKVRSLEKELATLEATEEKDFKAPPVEYIEAAVENMRQVLGCQNEQSAMVLRKLLGQIQLKPVFPENDKPYLLALSKLQPLALLEKEERPPEGPLTSEFDTNLDTGSNSLSWWRERRPTAKQSQSPRSS